MSLQLFWQAVPDASNFSEQTSRSMAAHEQHEEDARQAKHNCWSRPVDLTAGVIISLPPWMLQVHELQLHITESFQVPIVIMT